MDRILYLTSFNRKLYEATGQRLLATYRAHQAGQGCRLLVCHEDNLAGELQADDLLLYDLDQDDFLRGWLQRNRDIIPTALGGDLGPCQCPQRLERHAKHLPGCRGAFMNRNAARFFRKACALRHAAGLTDFDLLVWVDCDAFFQQPVPTAFISGLAAAVDIVYCCGKRRAPETGLVVYNFKEQGRLFIKQLCKLYNSPEFRQAERWDDTWMTRLILGTGQFRGRDLVNPLTQVGNDVIPQTVWASYIAHPKGCHSKGMNLVW